MKSTPLDQQIRSRIDSFLSDVSDLVKSSAIEAVRAALGGGSQPAPKRGPGRPPKAAAAPASSGKRARRSAADVAAVGEAFLAYVKANPGQSTEQIGRALGMATKELQRPVSLLVQSRAVRTEGQRRGTRYFAGGGSSGKRGRKRAKKA